MAGMQFGVRFRDGSVQHPWNGRTQRQRALEELARLRVRYPEDAPFITLVRRADPADPWTEEPPVEPWQEDGG